MTIVNTRWRPLTKTYFWGGRQDRYFSNEGRRGRWDLSGKLANKFKRKGEKYIGNNFNGLSVLPYEEASAREGRERRKQLLLLQSDDGCLGVLPRGYTQTGLSRRPGLQHGFATYFFLVDCSHLSGKKIRQVKNPRGEYTTGDCSNYRNAKMMTSNVPFITIPIFLSIRLNVLLLLLLLLRLRPKKRKTSCKIHQV